MAPLTNDTGTGDQVGIVAGPEPALVRAGLPDVKLHGLRYSFAPTLIRIGANCSPTNATNFQLRTLVGGCSSHLVDVRVD